MLTDDVTQEVRRRGAVDTIRQGIAEAPALGRGLAVTFVLALFGAAGRVTIPIVIQQSIDKGFVDGGARLDFIFRACSIASVIVLLAAACQRMAVFRLGTSAEEGLYGLRVRLFDHIHRLSLADQNDERRGALVAPDDMAAVNVTAGWRASRRTSSCPAKPVAPATATRVVRTAPEAAEREAEGTATAIVSCLLRKEYLYSPMHKQSITEIH